MGITLRNKVVTWDRLDIMEAQRADRMKWSWQAAITTPRPLFPTGHAVE